MQTRTPKRLSTMVVAIATAMVLLATPASAGKGGEHGPCEPGTLLAGSTLGEDVSYVARHGGTPLPQHFAFEDGPPPMPPGQLMKFARSVGMC